MAGYVIRRLLWSIFLLLAISLFAFVLFFVVPPETQQFGRGVAATDVNLRDSYGIQSGSVPAEYGRFLKRVFTEGSLGESYATRREVRDMLVAALPVTLSLVIGGTILFLLIAIPVGVVCALRPRTLLDRTLMIVVLLGVSAHPAWIGLILSYFFGYKWGVTPIAGYCDLVNAARRLRRAGAVGVSHDPPVVHLCRALRGALRPHGAGERARDARRGLRAHGPCEGSAALATCCARTCSAMRPCPS